MRTTWLIVGVAAMLITAGSGHIVAQEKKPPKAAPASRAADEKAIRNVAQAFAKAFEKGDANAIGAFFTEEGEYQPEDGETISGREALAKAYTDFFSKRPELKAESETDKIRFLSKDTAVEEGTFTVRVPDAPPDASRYSALYVREDNRWRMALLKEWGDDETDEPQLDDLAWLIGSWESDTGDSQAKTSYEWSDSQKFIKVHYDVEIKEKGSDKKLTSSGTQVIGIDPASKVVRAWTFDSEGGIGESHWLWDGDRWVIDSGATLADGSRTTSLNFLTRAGKDSFTWKSVKRTLDGEDMPDLEPVKVTRIKSKE